MKTQDPVDALRAHLHDLLDKQFDRWQSMPAPSKDASVLRFSVAHLRIHPNIKTMIGVAFTVGIAPTLVLEAEMVRIVESQYPDKVRGEIRRFDQPGDLG